MQPPAPQWECPDDGEAILQWDDFTLIYRPPPHVAPKIGDQELTHIGHWDSHWFQDKNVHHLMELHRGIGSSRDKLGLDTELARLTVQGELRFLVFNEDDDVVYDYPKGRTYRDIPDWVHKLALTQKPEDWVIDYECVNTLEIWTPDGSEYLDEVQSTKEAQEWFTEHAKTLC